MTTSVQRVRKRGRVRRRRQTSATSLAPDRIRGAANRARVTAWIILALLCLGFVTTAFDGGPPQFGGDAYTEIVSQLNTLNDAVVGLAVVMLFIACALLRALADLVEANTATKPSGQWVDDPTGRHTKRWTAADGSVTDHVADREADDWSHSTDPPTRMPHAP